MIFFKKTADMRKNIRAQQPHNVFGDRSEKWIRLFVLLFHQDEALNVTLSFIQPIGPYHHAHDLQLLQDKVHLLLRGQRGQHGVVAPAGQLGVVVRVLRSDELQAGVSYQVPTLTAHVFCNRKTGLWGWCSVVSGYTPSL